ncbi:MAG: hypothetical protein ACFFBR_02835 [Promethearchaeota archaeon]
MPIFDTEGFTMRILRKKRIRFVLFVILLSFLISIPTRLASLPTGLFLNYHVTDDLQGEWDEQFTIQSATSVQRNSLFLINISSTNEDILQGEMFLNSSTWRIILLNGTLLERPLQPPLWVNTSRWHHGHSVAFSPYTGNYPLTSSYISLEFGTFLCWRVQSVAWFSIDDDFQQCSENWYFHYTEGILLKYTYELLASQHAIYTYRVTRELTASNFHTLGILSLEEQNYTTLFWLGLGVLLLVILFGITFVFRHRHTKRFNTKPA